MSYHQVGDFWTSWGLAPPAPAQQPATLPPSIPTNVVRTEPLPFKAKTMPPWLLPGLAALALFLFLRRSK